jgi:hypothetical protein
MRPWFNKALTIFAVGLLAAGSAQAAERKRPLIPPPEDTNPQRVTRPATDADREWRRGRAAPELRYPPQNSTPTRRYEAPRYDSQGRRRNVPGRPDTLDAIGRTQGVRRPQTTIIPTGPTVRTDSGTRINQFPPR